jgi:hypothetical protein
MKKVISYLLAVLLLLNVMGYYGLFLGLKYHNTRSITQRLDQDHYHTSETITIRVPVAIPYLLNTDYQRVDGEIEHNGEFFRLVKQKFSSDTLYIVCIRDTRSKHIKQALEEYVKTFSDHPVNPKSTTEIPGFIKDYLPADFSLATGATGWNYSLRYHVNEDLTHLLSLPVSSPPPEA